MRDRVAKILFVLAVLALVWLYGVAAQLFQLFPQPQLMYLYSLSRQAVLQIMEENGLRHPWWYQEIASPDWQVKIPQPDEVSPGYVLVSGIKEDNELMVKIIDNQGKAVHEWDVDWFKLWPEPKHLPANVIPKRKPGSHIHGIVFLPNGDLVFNFERLGLIRLGYCGEVRWRLPRSTHHSVQADSNGNFWVPGRNYLVKPNRLDKFRNFTDGYIPVLLEVSPEGEIKSEIPVYDLLIDNGLNGLLYLSTKNNWGTRVSGDLLHLNDIEPFPGDMEGGVFQPGDLMISLRNINAIIVFNTQTRKIKYLSIGQVLRQHDPDFVDGNTISVFDNNNLSAATSERSRVEDDLSSRIVMLDARSGERTIYYEGTKAEPFFTSIMGEHQWLDNGNLLVTESRSGRAFELNPERQIVWEYQNALAGDLVGYGGLLGEAQRLPAEFDGQFFADLNKTCVAQ
jgi:hypothetical protein